MKHIPNISFENSENGNDFEVLDLSELLSRKLSDLDHDPTLPHRLSFFAILMVTKGTGSHQIDLKNYDLKPGTVLKIAKGQIHAFQKNANYEGCMVIFTEDFVLNYFSKSSVQIISHLYNYHTSSPISNDKKGNELFINQINQELNSNNTYAQHNIIAALIDLYLLKLERNTRANNRIKNIHSKQYPLFLQYKNLVESNFTKTRNVKDFASLLHVSTKKLNQVVKEFTLNTAKTFIDDYIILEIKRDIVSTNKSLKEIAFDNGFDEVTNFTKFFKKKMNRTPKEFRAKQIS